MLESDAIIEKVGRKFCWLRVPRRYLPTTCTRVCNGCTSCKEHEPGFFRIRVKITSKKPPKTGDKVRLLYKEPSSSMAALVLFIIPIVNMVLFGWLFSFIGNSDGWYIMGCGVGFMVGSFFMWLVESKFPGVFSSDGQVINWQAK